MENAQLTPSKSGTWALRCAYLGFGLALIAMLLLAVSPFGWRAGWWHFRVAFFSLMTYSAYIALAGLVLCAVALALGRSRLSTRGARLASIGLLMGAVLAYIPWQYNQTLKSVPRIHDITTDTERPPAFIAALPARNAEKAASVTYEGSELAKQQKAGYPDLAPLSMALPSAEAFKRALDVAKTMPGWVLVDTDAASGRIEANQTSRWFGFADDIVIRVVPDGAGSRIDMRSVSRQGRSDFGVNAERIRAYMTALKALTT